MRKRRNWLSNGTWSDYHRSNPRVGSPEGASEPLVGAHAGRSGAPDCPQVWTVRVHLWKLSSIRVTRCRSAPTIHRHDARDTNVSNNRTDNPQAVENYVDSAWACETADPVLHRRDAS